MGIKVGGFEIEMIANMEQYQRDLEAANRLTGQHAAGMAMQLDQVKVAIDAMHAAEQQRAGLFGRTMTETKRLLDLVKRGADETSDALDRLKIDPDALKVPQEALASLKQWRDQAAYAMGATAATAWDSTKKAWDSFKGWAERQVVIWGVALAIGISAAVLGAVYAAFKGISFAIGLLTGESYKSENIDALIAANKEVKELQGELHISAQDAGALGDALKRLAVPKEDFVGVWNAATGAMRTNQEELDRLGVKYKDQNGKLLEQREFLTNVVAVLETYRVGWDRNQAAAAIGVGSYEKLIDVLKVTSNEIENSRERLNDYNLGIGPETQAAVAQYQSAMREFNNESRLTGEGFKRAIADNIMPLLTQLAEFFRDGFPAAVNVFRYSIAVITTQLYGIKTVLYAVSETFVGFFATIYAGLSGLAIAAVRAAQGDFTGAAAAVLQGWENAKSRFAEIGSNMVAQARRNGDAIRLAWALDDRRAGGLVGGDAGKAWIPKPDKPNDVKALTDPYDALIKSVQEKTAAMAVDIDATERATEAEKIFAKYLSDLDHGYIAFNKTKDVTLSQALMELDRWERQKRAAEALRKEIDALAGSNDKLAGDIQSQREYIDRLGMSALAVAELEAAKLRDAAASNEAQVADALLRDGTGQLAEQFRIAAARLRELADLKTTRAGLDLQVEQFRSVWQSIDRTAHDVWTNIFEGGSNVFHKLRDVLKASLLDLLYQLTLRKWIINITAGITGAGANIVAAATGNALSGGPLAGVIGNALAGPGSAIDSAMGAFGYGSGIAGAGAGSAEIAGTVASTSEGLLAAGASATEAAAAAGALGESMAATTAATTAFGTGITGLLAAIPGWGWAIAGVAALVGMFSGSHHGPKQDAVSADLVGSTLGLGNRSASGDAGVTQTAAQWQAMYQNALAVYGKRGDLSFGLGLSTDPQGTSPSFVDVSLSRNGAGDSLFGSRSVGRSDAELQAAIQQYLASGLIKGLQEAHLDGKIGDLLAGLGDVAGKSAADITAAMNAINAQVAADQAIVAQRAGLDERYYKDTASAADQAARARQAELDAMDDSNRERLRYIQTLELEKTRQQQLSGLLDKAIGLGSEFFSQAQLQALLIAQIQSKLSTVGISISAQQLMDASRDSFLAALQGLVQGGNLDAAGVVLDVASAFAQLHPVAQQAADDIQQVQEALAGAGKDLYFYLRELRANRGGTASPVDAAAGTLANYQQDMALARGGDVDAYKRLQSSITAAIDAQKTLTASGPATQALIDRILSEGSSLPAVASYEQQNIALLQQINASINLNTNALTVLRESIVARLDAGFGQIDTNHSGGIDMGEFLRATEGLATEETLLAMFATLDTDGNGIIVQQELTNVGLSTLQATLVDRIVSGFTTLDRNMDGLLDRSEFMAGLQGLASQGTLQALFSTMDSNGDGQISRLEAIAAASGGTKTNLDALLQRIGTDSILAYGASAVATAYKAIIDNTWWTQARVDGSNQLLKGIGDTLAAMRSGGGMPVVGGGGSTPALTTTTSTLAATIAAATGPASTAAATAPASSATQADVDAYQAAAASGMGVYAFAESLGYTAAQTSAWLASTGFPAFETGTARIFGDGLAQLHDGERVVTAADNEMLSPLLEELSRKLDALINVEVAGHTQTGNAARRTADGVETLLVQRPLERTTYTGLIQE